MWCVLRFKTDTPPPPHTHTHTHHHRHTHTHAHTHTRTHAHAHTHTHTHTAVHRMRVPFGVLQRTPPTSTATDLASAAVNVDTKRARLFDGTLAVWANSDRSVSSRLSSTGSTYSGSLAPAELSHTQTSSTHTHTRSHERGGVRVCGMRRTQGSVHGRG
jgi:hypothetical protein